MPGDDSRKNPISPLSPHDPSELEVYNGHHTAPMPIYPPSASSYTDTHTLSVYPKAPSAAQQQISDPPEKKLCGIRLGVLLIVVSGLLLLVIAGLGLCSRDLRQKNCLSRADGSHTHRGQTLYLFSPSRPTTIAPPPHQPKDHLVNPPHQPKVPQPLLQQISTHITAPNYRYISCYIDDLERILTQQFAETGSIKMTNQACADFCGEGRKYFGTEAGQQCYCGDLIAERAMKADFVVVTLPRSDSIRWAAAQWREWAAFWRPAIIEVSHKASLLLDSAESWSFNLRTFILFLNKTLTRPLNSPQPAATHAARTRTFLNSSFESRVLTRK